MFGSPCSFTLFRPSLAHPVARHTSSAVPAPKDSRRTSRPFRFLEHSGELWPFLALVQMGQCFSQNSGLNRGTMNLRAIDHSGMLLPSGIVPRPTDTSPRPSAARRASRLIPIQMGRGRRGSRTVAGQKPVGGVLQQATAGPKNACAQRSPSAVATVAEPSRTGLPTCMLYKLTNKQSRQPQPSAARLPSRPLRRQRGRGRRGSRTVAGQSESETPSDWVS